MVRARQIFAVMDGAPARGSSCCTSWRPPVGISARVPGSMRHPSLLPRTVFHRVAVLQVRSTLLDGTGFRCGPSTCSSIQPPIHVRDVRTRPLRSCLSHPPGLKLHRRSRVLLPKLMRVNPLGRESGSGLALQTLMRHERLGMGDPGSASHLARLARNKVPESHPTRNAYAFVNPATGTSYLPGGAEVKAFKNPHASHT